MKNNKKNEYKKLYWVNYFQFWATFILVSIIFSSIGYYDDMPIDFKYGFGITLVISVFILAHMIAKKYAISEKFDELRQEEGLTYGEFNSKYAKIFEIIDETKKYKKSTKKELSPESKELLLKFLRKTGQVKD